ncbi:MAG: PQQ-binding-like beta-propeller repeat protein [Elusimicrobiota bacterium]
MKKFFLIFFIVSAQNLKADWSSFMGNYERNAFKPVSLKIPFTKAYDDIKVPGSILSSPVIYNKKLVITTRFGYIIAFDIENGRWLWDYSSSGFIDATPSVVSNTVVVPSMDGYLYAIDLNSSGNGLIKWQTDLGAPSVSSPLIYKNKVYVGVGVPENSLKIVDFYDGKVLKTLKFEKPINSAVALCSDRIIFGGNDGRIYSIDENGGDLKYYPTSGGNFNMKAISCHNSRLYALPGYDERSLYKFDTNLNLILKTTDLTQNTGSDVWNWQHTSSIALSTYAAYFVVGNSATYLYGINQDFSSVVFSSFPIGVISDYNIVASPALSNDYIFLTTNLGKFYVIDSTGGTVLYDDILSSSSYSVPAISDGYIAVTSVDGSIAVYKALSYIDFDIRDEEIITSTYPIKINALNPDATYYILDYSSDMENYNFLISINFAKSQDELKSYIIYNWDTTQIENGVYYLRIRYGDLYAIKRIRINQKPLPPQNLVVYDNPNDNCNKLILNWQSEKDYTYRIYRKKLDENNFSLITSTTGKSYIDNTALCGTTFTYVVSAYDGFMESDYSNYAWGFSINDNPLNDNIAPSKVNDLSASEGSCGGSVALFWTESGDDDVIGKANNYEIGYSSFLPFVWEDSVISTGQVNAMAGSIENAIVSNLFYGVTYYFAVKVYDYAQNSSELSNLATSFAKIDLTLPAPPTNFVVYDADGDRGGKLVLEWDLSDDDFKTGCDEKIYGYKIFRSTLPTFNYSVYYATVNPGVNGYIDKNAVAGIRYYYKVCAYDSSNLSCSQTKDGISADNYRFVSVEYGGQIVDLSGGKIFIPQNSLNQNDYLIFYKLSKEDITRFLNLSSFRASSNLNFKPTEIVYKLESSNPNTKLLSNATITIPYVSTQIAHIVEDNLRMYYYDNGKWTLLRNSKLNKELKYVEASFDKFGYYGVFGYEPQGSVFDDEWVYVYPNPARGDKITFKFVVNYKSDVEIEIYNVAGEIIDKLERKNCDGGIITEIDWSIKNIASGVYVYLFKADGEGGKKKVIKKFAVIK